MILRVSTDWIVVGLLLAGLIALNAFLMWANSTQRKDNQKLRRRLLMKDPQQVAEHLLDELRDGGDR